MKWKSLFIVLCVIGVIAGILGNVNSSNNNSKTNTTFSNQYISFTIPDNTTVTDNSNSTGLNVKLYQGNSFIGEITSQNNTQSYLNGLISESNKTTITISNKTAYEDTNGTLQSWITTTNSSNGVLGIFISFGSTYSMEYYIVKSSLVIKQNPTQ